MKKLIEGVRYSLSVHKQTIDATCMRVNWTKVLQLSINNGIFAQMYFNGILTTCRIIFGYCSLSHLPFLSRQKYSANLIS